jgi:hypothetical protein
MIMARKALTFALAEGFTYKDSDRAETRSGSIADGGDEGA